MNPNARPLRFSAARRTLQDDEFSCALDGTDKSRQGAAFLSRAEPISAAFPSYGRQVRYVFVKERYHGMVFVASSGFLDSSSPALRDRTSLGMRVAVYVVILKRISK
jgi:hypothetical protein